MLRVKLATPPAVMAMKEKNGIEKRPSTPTIALNPRSNVGAVFPPIASVRNDTPSLIPPLPDIVQAGLHDRVVHSRIDRWAAEDRRELYVASLDFGACGNADG